jgi:hypothetical protein
MVEAGAATASITNATAVSYAVAAAVAVAAAIAVTATISITPTATPVTVIPGAGADEDATHEPARSVVAIRRASVGVVGVITPAADRGWAVTIAVVISVSRIDADTHTDLSIRRSGQ